MSTFGNKGERERNPNKPKFAALDINSLYRSTRGETFEPATQKNAAPRKHGMQSLGKVPSARRPPANLPSLKAETSIPAVPPSQVSNEQQQTNANNASWADSNSSGTQNSTINAVSSNNNPALSNINHNNTNSNSQVQGNQLQQQQQQQQGALSNNNNNNSNNNSSSTWSAVATGGVKEDSASQPPLYQSPQFQNEFPSLDGTLMATTSSGSIQNVNAQQQKLQNQNSFDSGGGNLNLRPSTDVASWMQQQQQLNSANSGNVRGAGGENGQQGNFQTPEIDGPPKVMALMPSFLRGGNTGIANINTAPSSAPSGPPSQPNYQQHKSNMNNNNNNNNNMGNRSGRQNNNNNKYDNSSHYNEYSNGLPPRHRQQPPRHYSGRQNNNNNNNNNNNSNNDERSSFEPELIVQRPIIKEEELERIDSLARDDAWSKHDEVDYNKKLQFSDDEADDMKMKDDRKIDVWRDSEKREMKQQNGPRSIDPSYIEKMKMVREEEERLERERKVAAQRKLQELEEKSKQQKMQISLDKPHEKEIEEKPISGINYTINDSDKKVDHQQNQQQQTQRDYGKSSKYMNDNKFDLYDSQYGRNNNTGGADYIKKTTFQSNLPPRFQKQQQYGDRPDDRREKGPQNNYKPLHQQDSKNIPFIQHPQSSYDQQQQQNQQQQQRWMQYNKGNQQGNPPRRNMSSLSQSSSDDNRQNNSKQPYNSRRRQESEEDDYGRFIKESTSTGSLKKSQTVPSAQISRSMSDSSDKLSDHNRSEKSTSREFLTGSNVCWAEVCENDKRSSLDAKEKRRVSESSAISDDQPRTILQRNKPLQEQLSTKENVVKKESCKETKDEEQKTVLSEQSPPKELIELEKKEKVVETVPIDQQQQQQQSLQSKKSLDIIPEKEQNIMAEKVQQLDNSANKDMMKSKEMPPKELDDSRHSSGSNKRSPHSNRYEPSMRGRGNSSYGGYRGNWQRRGGSSGGHSRSGRYDYSDSENSEEYDHDSWNRKPNRKDINRRDNYGASGLQKEGFSPRGEPSRRGRGGGSSMTTSQSNFRRTGSNVSNNSIAAPVKRIDNYGPPSSKSPFSTSDEKSGTSEKKDIKEKEKLSDDDRMKQKQKALSDGLINKNMKDNSNLAMQKASSPTSKSNEESANKQHSNDIQQPITQSASSSSITQQQDIKKEIVTDEKNVNDGKNRVTNTTTSVPQSYNSRQQQSKFDSNKSTAPINKSTVNKSPMSSTQQSSTGKSPVSSVSTSSSTVTTTVAMTSQTSTTTQYNNSGMNNSKQLDSRNSSQTNNKYDNSNYRDSRTNDPRNNGSNRMAPRFAKQQRDPTSSNQRVSGNYWDKNNAEGLNDDSNKVSLMQQLNSSNSSGSLSNQQVSTTTNNSNVLKTDMIKQQQQQQQQQVGQVSQQNPQNQQNQSMTTASSAGNQPMLDGASLPKQTLIFENTSYKSAPPSLKRPPQLGGPPNAMNQHPQKDSTPTINEMIEQQAKDHSLTSALQNLSFGQKSDMVDMNSFKFSFDTQLTDDGNAGGFGSVSSSSTHTSQAVSKASSLGLVGAKTGMQNSNILNTDALNMKVASCKKVWEEPSVEHSTTNADDVMNFVAQQQLQHYAHNNINAHHTGLSPQSFSYAATSSANDHASSLEHFNKANDNDDPNSYQSQHMSAHVMHSQNQQANLNMKAAEAFATQNANVCKVKPTQMHQSGLSPPPQMQQNPLQQHQQQFYQTPSYANMPTIPSPPVVYNSAQATAGGLYNPYNMDAARAQMYSYPQSATNNSLSFNAFMQTPNIASAPTHEMYQNLSQYRATVQPYNQTPQLNNPNAAAVLISSATPSNSMMSSKSNTPQQIGAIGSKSSAPQSAPPTATANQYNQQQYMNHLYHQNSYYPSSTAQQANPYYNTTGTAATGNYGMFGGTTSAPPQQQMNYGSVGQFPLNSQMLNNLVINQQYRSGPVVAAGSSNSGSANSGSNSNTSGYMKQQQQHQSQLQDPTPIMKFSSMNESHSKGYNNWDISPSLSYNSNSYNRGHSSQNYNSSQHQSSQRMPKVVNNNQLFPNLTSSSQGKSQFYGNNSSQPSSK